MKIKHLFPILCILYLLVFACRKPEKEYKPTHVYTLQPLEIDTSSAIFRGKVSEGTDDINEFGFEWRKITDTVFKTITVQSTNGHFSFMVTGLEEDTEYAVRAFVANKDSLWYAKVFSFFTKGTVADIDGNIYLTLRYGDKMWMTENLRVTRFADGTPIKGHSIGEPDFNGPLFFFDESHTPNPLPNQPKFGLLYNSFAAMCNYKFIPAPIGFQKVFQGVCPDGWHLSTAQEWENLFKFCTEMHNASVIVMKTSNWPDPPYYANNHSLFSVDPAGYFEWKFEGLYESALFWNGPYILFNFNEPHSVQLLGDPGCSVRCVKD